MPHAQRALVCLAALAVLLAILLAAWAPPAPAQIPDTFTNLKVLPKDTPKPELTRVMRGFSSALGVRCIHCHTAKDPADFSTMDFASDEKETKKIARAMMKLTGEINASLGREIGALRPARLEVGCFTCHHGNYRPETLEEALTPIVKKDGADAAIARYRELRDEYYGQAAYDFSEWSLILIAENLSKDAAQIPAARSLLNLNLEFYPESAGTYARIAETYLVKGDRDAALQNFDKALTLAPEDPWLKRRVDRVKAGN